jgi:hypothetical protein
VSLGAKKCIEDLLRLLWGEPYAGVADGHLWSSGSRKASPNWEKSL